MKSFLKNYCRKFFNILYLLLENLFLRWFLLRKPKYNKKYKISISHYSSFSKCFLDILPVPLYDTLDGYNLCCQKKRHKLYHRRILGGISEYYYK